MDADLPLVSAALRRLPKEHPRHQKPNDYGQRGHDNRKEETVFVCPLAERRTLSAITFASANEKPQVPEDKVGAKRGNQEDQRGKQPPHSDEY
jgi:hypothetical protein